MAATRFYLPAIGSGTPPVSPAFNANWEQKGSAVRLKLLLKKTLSVLTTLANTSSITIPITTTQDILAAQFVSDPLPANIRVEASTFSGVMRAAEATANGNVTLAFVLSYCNQSGGSVVNLTSLFGTGTEFAVTGSDATRIINAAALSAVTIPAGSRIIFEVGARATAPAAADSFVLRFGNSAATDFALTAALTTDLNPWVEFSKDLFSLDNNNLRFVKAPNGISVTEKFR